MVLIKTTLSLVREEDQEERKKRKEIKEEPSQIKPDLMHLVTFWKFLGSSSEFHPCSS